MEILIVIDKQVCNALELYGFVSFCVVIKKLKDVQHSLVPSTNYLEMLLGFPAILWLFLVIEARCYATGNDTFFKD